MIRAACHERAARTFSLCGREGANNSYNLFANRHGEARRFRGLGRQTTTFLEVVLAKDRAAGAADMPPVFVMNLHYTGLGIARNLRAMGASVYGLSADPQAPAAKSRYLRKVYTVHHSKDAPDRLLDELLALRGEHSLAPVLFPTCDADVLFLAEHASALSSSYRLPSGLAALPQLMDKLELAALATQSGIATPKTTLCTGEEQLEAIGQGLTFPVVVKPRSAHEWRKVGIWEKVGARKAFRVDSPAQLRDEIRALAPYSRDNLVQEYIAGDDRDIVVCCCYIDASGQLVGHFTGRKLLQSPPLFGTGCLVEACPVPEIVETTRTLLSACGYVGIAEVEFKRVPTTGRYTLIEVNPRHWDQHELGTRVGVNLSAIAYCAAAGRPTLPQTPSYPEHAHPRWVAEREALMLTARNALEAVRRDAPRAGRLATLCRVSWRSLRNYAALMQRPLVLPVFSLRDPRPGIALCIQLLSELTSLAFQARTKP
jgi:D-aspartate ligase